MKTIDNITRARSVAKLKQSVRDALHTGKPEKDIRDSLYIAMLGAIDRQDERIGHAIEVYRKTLHIPAFWSD